MSPRRIAVVDTRGISPQGLFRTQRLVQLLVWKRFKKSGRHFRPTLMRQTYAPARAISTSHSAIFSLISFVASISLHSGKRCARGTAHRSRQ